MVGQLNRTAQFNCAPKLSFAQRLLLRLANVLASASSHAVLPGRDGDGLVAGGTLAPAYDAPWPDLAEQLADARQAWRDNPLARRIVGLITAYVVGDGLQIHADDPDLAAFAAEFAAVNRLHLRLADWCDELARAGELFLTLHLNQADGMSYVRALPAASIDRIEADPEDYETELSYHQLVPMSDPTYPAGRTWLAPQHPQADTPLARAGRRASDRRYGAVMLHFAVNRPIGALRGESDLAPITPWLRRYNRWLEDRVRLNAAVRAFLWVVRVPSTLIEAKRAEHATPPDAGSVLVIDRDKEEWQAVAPTLHANDAAADGRAVRWMIAAGGPGIGLVDLGEAEDANLATAQAMAEQRTRFMRARQNYFTDLLATVIVTAYNRKQRLRFDSQPEQPASALSITAPDITPEDNAQLAQSAYQLARALQTVSTAGVRGPTWRRTLIQLVLKFAGEALDEPALDAILKESTTAKRDTDSTDGTDLN